MCKTEAIIYNALQSWLTLSKVFNVVRVVVLDPKKNTNLRVKTRHHLRLMAFAVQAHGNVVMCSSNGPTLAAPLVSGDLANVSSKLKSVDFELL